MALLVLWYEPALPLAWHPGSFSPRGVLRPAGLTESRACQAQLIHDRNTASHTTVAARTQAPPTPDKVQMTWTREKLIAEKHRNKDASLSGFKDLFSMKPFTENRELPARAGRGPQGRGSGSADAARVPG
ncbi:hypothetical protein P7K49_004357 [Saguinus oedipus]|uniref:Uncharacterized protein n=1 Tax=Saguinus oedipus TaxID=9490 RepID=A0ABQ9W7V4_SAGOE|nr:hypothetical protein P7K49_004357 [Saguinus oedipus]